MKRARKPAEPTATAAEIRERLGISERSCSRLLAELAVVRRGAGGRNPVVQLWDLVKLLHERGARTEPTESEREQAEIRREHARKLRRQNELEEGKLMSIEDAQRELRAIFAAFRIEAEAVGRTHGPAVDADVRKMIDRADAESRARLLAERPGVTT